MACTHCKSAPCRNCPEARPVFPPPAQRVVMDTWRAEPVSFHPTKEAAEAECLRRNSELGFVRFVVRHHESDWTRMPS